jgi:hypothetical protein
MYKLAAVALVIGLLAACSSMPGNYSTSSLDSSTANPPRSPGEGPSFTPYGAAGR